MTFSTVVDNFLVTCKDTKSNPGSTQKLCFFQEKSIVKQSESGLYISPQKDWYNALFVNFFQTMQYWLLLLMALMTGTTLISSKLMKTQKNTEMPC